MKRIKKICPLVVVTLETGEDVPCKTLAGAHNYIDKLAAEAKDKGLSYNVIRNHNKFQFKTHIKVKNYGQRRNKSRS